MKQVEKSTLRGLKIARVSLCDEPANQKSLVYLYKSASAENCRKDEFMPRTKDADADADAEARKDADADAEARRKAKKGAHKDADADADADSDADDDADSDADDDADAAKRKAKKAAQGDDTLGAVRSATPTRPMGGSGFGKDADADAKKRKRRAGVDDSPSGGDDSDTGRMVEKSDLVARIEKSEAQVRLLTKRLEQQDAQMIEKAFIEKATTSYKGLSLKPETFGPIMKALADIDPEAEKELDRVLKAASATVKASKSLFTTIGVGGEGEAKVGGGSAEDQLMSLVDVRKNEIKKSGGKPNIASIQDEVFRENPELYTRYVLESRKRNFQEEGEE